MKKAVYYQENFPMQCKLPFAGVRTLNCFSFSWDEGASYHCAISAHHFQVAGAGIFKKTIQVLTDILWHGVGRER
eukprot:766203-Hanusia_phi.AAC.7